MEDEKVDLKWGRFSTQIALAIFIMVLGFVAVWFLEHGVDTQTNRIIGAAIALVIVVVTGVIYRGVSRNTDEFERRVETHALAQAGFFVIIYMMIMSVQSYFWSSDTKPMTIFAAPGFLLLYRALMAQYMRWYMVHGTSDEISKHF